MTTMKARFPFLFTIAPAPPPREAVEHRGIDDTYPVSFETWVEDLEVSPTRQTTLRRTPPEVHTVKQIVFQAYHTRTLVHYSSTFVSLVCVSPICTVQYVCTSVCVHPRPRGDRGPSRCSGYSVASSERATVWLPGVSNELIAKISVRRRNVHTEETQG